MSAATPNILEIGNLAVSISGTPIVHGVSFKASAGSLSVIVGPNGSGKSTLLKAITGELNYSGSVALNGTRVENVSPEALAPLRAVLPQHTSLAFPLTVAEVVRLGIRRGISTADNAQRRVSEALERVDLSGFAPRAYQSLSGGEQQRVQLARVLCQVWEPCPHGIPRWPPCRHPSLSDLPACQFPPRGSSHRVPGAGIAGTPQFVRPSVFDAQNPLLPKHRSHHRRYGHQWLLAACQ
mgnify:CR=1 FL=1